MPRKFNYGVGTDDDDGYDDYDDYDYDYDNEYEVEETGKEKILSFCLMMRITCA